MRKILLLVTALLLSCSLYAQNSGINRVLLHQANQTKGFVLNNVDSLTFAKVEGEVAANIELIDFDLEKLTLAVTRTLACDGFKISVEPTVTIAQMSDLQLATYIDSQTTYVYYQNFDNAELTGIELTPNTEYTVVTVGIDIYGVLCDVKRVEFKSPTAPVVGDPKVTAELVEANLYDFTVKFTPNEDVSKYSVVAGEKGALEYQYEQFAPMMGFTNIGQMIESWGLPRETEENITWEDQAPNTEYEVFIQAWDVNGTMVAEHQVFELKTESLGGEGTAEVTIEIGDYELADWGGEMLPSQFITFTPNDQASAYRVSVYTAEVYDPEAKLIKEELCSEPPMPNMLGWYLYEEITTDYQINPDIECVAIAAAKNINGEWGPITEVRFTTPADMPSKSVSKIIKERKLVNNKNEAGKIPAIKQNRLQLIGK